MLSVYVFILVKLLSYALFEFYVLYVRYVYIIRRDFKFASIITIPVSIYILAEIFFAFSVALGLEKLYDQLVVLCNSSCLVKFGCAVCSPQPRILSLYH